MNSAPVSDPGGAGGASWACPTHPSSPAAPPTADRRRNRRRVAAMSHLVGRGVRNDCLVGRAKSSRPDATRNRPSGLEDSARPTTPLLSLPLFGGGAAVAQRREVQVHQVLVLRHVPLVEPLHRLLP